MMSDELSLEGGKRSGQDHCIWDIETEKLVKHETLYLSLRATP